MADEDDIGALTIGDLNFIDDMGDVGALRRRRGRSVRTNRTIRAGRLIPRVPGAPAVGLRLQPLGFNSVTFQVGSGSSLTTTSRPQRPFKGKRLAIDIARTGTTSTGLVQVTAILIGTNNQLVSAQPIGAGTFAPGAYDTNLELAACSAGLDITLQFAISAVPTTTDTVVVQPTLLGEAVG